MKYTTAVGLCFGNMDADVDITFIYKPGKSPEGPEIEILDIEVFGITTWAGLEIDGEWLRDRGWFELATKIVRAGFDVAYEPGGSIWYDLLEAIEND